MVKTISFAEARHLVARSGLGVEWNQIKNLEGRSRQQAIEILLRPKSSRPPAPSKMTSWHVRTNMYESKNPKHKMKMHEMTTIEGARLKRWWISHMLKTQSPIIEKMTLFWHGHFASSLDKVEQPSLLYKQNMMLRRHSMGNFATLLKAVAKDPAMSVYLDGQLNEKKNPNENFARELLELFTVGHGHYSESDVKNIARAFTGQTVNRFQETYAFNKVEHDLTPKHVLGKRVNTGDDVIRVLLEHPRTAMTIADKFWSLFVSDAEPDQRVTTVWAKKFRNSRYDIKVLLREVLNSEAFWAKEHRGTVTKSPVDLVIGSLRTIPSRAFSPKDVEGILRLLGQDLFDPANVKGWKSGLAWIDAETIMVRSSMVNKLTGANLNEKINKGNQYPDAPPEQYKQWLLPQKPISPPPSKPGKVRLVRTLALDPLYQLM
ncbi:MAG: DUF1800 domain-containing protein [Thiotrichaceae bacterium]